MNKLTTGATLGLSIGAYKAAIGALIALSVLVMGKDNAMTPDTAGDALALVAYVVAAWMHSKAAPAGAAETPAKPGVTQ